jgi:hypothetical protein
LAFAVTVTLPELSVVDPEPVMAAEAPEPGGVNVTATPETGFPLASVTTATSGEANDVPTVVVCGLPLPTAMFAAAPAVLVSENDVGVATPVAAALTV